MRSTGSRATESGERSVGSSRDNGVPWAHLDIAGFAFTDTEDSETSKGGTGFGIRIFLDTLANFEPPAAAD
ncbi:hypothetical protein [Candidatus Poriferisocius sp.]|uniref:hypothetical protein n=1 Tax=Candidatus Poriferisocius sp. TaxID=3101276 RepID=UPI003B5B19A1